MADIIKELASTKVISKEMRGMAYSLVTLADGIRDSIDANGKQMLKGMTASKLPEMKDVKARQVVMDKTRKEILTALADKDYTKISTILDGDLLKGLADRKLVEEFTQPGSVAAWPAAVAAVVVVATLAHSVYTSVAKNSLAERFSNPQEQLFNRAGRFAWF